MRIALGFVAFFGVLGVASGAEAHPLLDDAVAAYEEADFQVALRTFNAAARNADLSVEELLKLFEMRALVHHALGDEDAMLDDLRRLAAVRPSYRLGRLAPPPVRRALEDLLDANGGSLGVELVIEEDLAEGVPSVVARVHRVPEGLVDHIALQCRVAPEGKTIARSAQGARVRIELPSRGGHRGCDAKARTRQGAVLFSTSIEGAGANGGPNVFGTPEYWGAADGSASKRRKKWPWIVAAAVVVVAGGVATGIVLSRRSNESQPAGGVTVNW